MLYLWELAKSHTTPEIRLRLRACFFFTLFVDEALDLLHCIIFRVIVDFREGFVVQAKVDSFMMLI